MVQDDISNAVDHNDDNLKTYEEAIQGSNNEIWQMDVKTAFLIGTGITLSREDCSKTPEERERMSKITYASAVGTIMYTMTCTCPDVAYALGVTKRYQANPSEEHWKVVKTILKYLRRTKHQFLIYPDSELKLEGYTDASFSSDRDDSKSISGYVFTLNGGAVSWKSSKQARVADSVIEAEYIAASEATKEVVWMKRF
ncbi:secreted RxLR effector protein 161-like [Nicotiana sylvestris]|uniref:secreted RxLR effector protein 161-like n=1 Tax=Nicotiana sylvestris TaxID=4096 RepID=UPI00388C3967